MPASDKVYSGLSMLPMGKAADTIYEGCLVLEGGAFRGLYTSGFLDALMEAGINLQTVIGTSAGALNGMYYMARQIGQTARINLEYRHDKRYVGRKALLKNRGIMGFDFALNEAADVPLDEKAFNDPRRRFVAVVTNCLTGEAEYHERGNTPDIIKSVQASATMPLLSLPVYIGGVPYLDGGIGCKIAYQWALDQGYKKIIVLKTREAGFLKNEMGTPEIRAIEKVYRRYPAFAEAFISSDRRYNEQTEEILRLDRRGVLMQFSPQTPVGIGRLEGDMEVLGDLYYQGYHEGRRAVPKILEYLGDPIDFSAAENPLPENAFVGSACIKPDIAAPEAA